MERLDEAAIWRFLRDARVGRLAIHDHVAGSTELTPVFFAATEGRIYFSSQPGRKLELMRLNPHGIGVQCDQQLGEAWISVFGSGHFREVGPGAEYAQATWLLGRKYRFHYLGQIGQQARQALKGGPAGVWRTVRGATLGCIDFERISGRLWRNDAGA